MLRKELSDPVSRITPSQNTQTHESAMAVGCKHDYALLEAVGEGAG